MTGASRVLRVLGVVASPSKGGKTWAAVHAVVSAAQSAGFEGSVAELAIDAPQAVVSEVARADAIVLGTPVYRASHSALLSGFLESIERGRPHETSAPLRGKAVTIVMTGAAPQHYLASERLRGVLASFFAVQVLSPSFYLDSTAFHPDSSLTHDAQTIATIQGTALCELATAVSQSEVLRRMEPLI